MLSKEEAVKIFSDSGALMKGHFKLTSGRHSNYYMQCAQVLQYPHYTEELARDIADFFRSQGVELVVGPAMGGIIVSYEVARQLGVPSIFAERQDGKMTLRRNFSIKPGQKVLVVEDVITTGGSVLEVLELVKEMQGEIVGVGVLVDRSGGKVDFEVPLHSVLEMQVESWEAADCPLCKSGVDEAVKPGSR